MVVIETTVDGVFSSEDALRPYGVTDVRMPCMADIAAKLTGQFAGCLADKIRGPAATTSGPTGSEPTEAPAATPGLCAGTHLRAQRRRIVIMTAPVPPGTVPPTRAML
jgi:hypothetical protein